MLASSHKVDHVPYIMSDERNLMTISLTFLITLIVAVAGGVFALTKYASYERVENLKEQLNAKNEVINKINSNSNRIQIDSSFLPTEQISEELNDPDIQKLAARIADLEVERKELIAQLSERAVASLDPRSEVSNLLSELNSDNEMISNQAVLSLFKISDPITFKPMVEYFTADPAKATKNPFSGASEWFQFFIRVDKTAGYELIVNQLESNDPGTKFLAESYVGNVRDIEDIDILIPYLENVAISNKRASVRGTAKAFIQKLNNEKLSILEEEKEFGERISIFGLLEKILTEIESLKAPSNNASQ